MRRPVTPQPFPGIANPPDRRGKADARSGESFVTHPLAGAYRCTALVTECDEAYLSLLQSRGVMFFSFAYAAADSSIIPHQLLVRLDPVGDHLPLVPSHCRNLTAPPPS